MKKILFVLTIGFISISATGNCAVTQKADNPIAFNDAKIFKSAIRYLAAMETPGYLGEYIADEKNVNSKAKKDFTSRFAQANDAKWYSDQNGFVSYFVVNGYGNRAIYDKKGHWQYSLIFYGEDKLPRDIRAIARSHYFDLSITLVEEVQTPNGNAFFIHMEDKSSIKIIKMNADGEMETVQDLVKE
jgi:hypothetical protein